jgi:hypothetical protein
VNWFKYFLYGLLGTALLFVLVTYVQAAPPPYPITITTCRGYTVSKRGDGAIFVRCPGMPADKWMFSIAAGCCLAPVLVKRPLSLTIDCK